MDEPDKIFSRGGDMMRPEYGLVRPRFRAMHSSEQEYKVAQVLRATDELGAVDLEASRKYASLPCTTKSGTRNWR